MITAEKFREMKTIEILRLVETALIVLNDRIDELRKDKEVLSRIIDLVIRLDAYWEP